MLALQCKLARLALGLRTNDLAELVGMSPNAIHRLEKGEELKASTVSTIRTALEQAGVVFIAADEEAGPGVRLKVREAR